MVDRKITFTQLLGLAMLLLFTTAAASAQTPPIDTLPPPATDDDVVFVIVQEMPLFPGCKKTKKKNYDKRRKCADKLMRAYVAENIIYPAEAVRNNVEGIVVIQFIVEMVG